jgi:hypothetical protein
MKNKIVQQVTGYREWVLLIVLYLCDYILACNNSLIQFFYSWFGKNGFVRKGHLFLIFTGGLLLLLLSGCSRTFFGTLLILSFRDLMLYVGLSLFMGVVAALLNKDSRFGFWLGFLLSLVLTPIAGLIYCLVILTRRD